MTSLGNLTADSPIAPQSPISDRIFECMDETTTEAKLELKVTTTALELAKSTYDSKIQSYDDAYLSTNLKEIEVSAIELDVVF